ncbi:hypothetical protein AB5N19_06541 [Seiridium cardinale]|uniref:Uncharacterized protein n=1 Tax=Seiridium cardinale TaxID=138064 RepID=A0ABR2XZP8_9PEZI
MPCLTDIMTTDQKCNLKYDPWEFALDDRGEWFWEEPSYFLSFAVLTDTSPRDYLDLGGIILQEVKG